MDHGKENARQPRHVYTQHAPSRGGARSGAGRPAGQTTKISAGALLEAVFTRTGSCYSDILISDFLDARAGDDRGLVHKYHTLIAGKVLADQVNLEVRDTSDVVAAREAAFAAALARLRDADINNRTDQDDPDATT